MHSQGRRSVTTANYFGIGRALLGPPTAAVLLQWNSWTVPLLMTSLVAATLSDILDGYFGRRQGQDTAWGVYLDETADKIYMTCVLVPLAWHGRLPKAAVLLILIGYFAIGGFRSYAISHGLVVRPTIWGKASTILTLPALFLAVLDHPAAVPLVYSAVAAGLVSGVVITLRNPEYRRIIRSGLFAGEHNRRSGHLSEGREKEGNRGREEDPI